MTKKSLQTAVGKKPKNFILIAVISMTLYFNPSLQDPFNSPKLWLLILTGSWLIGYIFTNNSNRWSQYEQETKIFISLTMIFLISMLISSLLTYNKFEAFFGIAGRRLGFLTYLFFVIFMLAASNIFNLHAITRLYHSVFLISVLLVIYGFMQTTANDFVTWNNPYNSIIGTFGNPNFASAGMAMFAIICYSTIFITKFSLIIRIICALTTVGSLVLIILSDSRQGLIVFAVGFSIFSLILIFTKNKTIGLFSFITFILTGIIAVLGMLQIGPLQKFLYKPSISVRGFYWDAAYEMIKNKPLFGTGTDQYGLYFRFFRDIQYPLSYGFDITSSNAHNIPLQLMSTGGIFVGISYLAIMIFVLVIGTKTLIKLKGQERYLLAGVLAAWVGFQAQSIISIENIGLGIWNWIFSGVMIGVSRETTKLAQIPVVAKERKFKFENNLTLVQPLVSGFFVLVFVLLISALYTGENQTITARSLYDPTKQAQSREFYVNAERALSNKFNDPYYKLIVIEMLAQTDDYATAFANLKVLYSKNPESLDYLRPLAIISEKNGDFQEAVGFRQLIAKNDPWNLDNYLRLGLLYKGLGDSVKMQEMQNKIINLAPTHIIAQTAKIKLVL